MEFGIEPKRIVYLFLLSILIKPSIQDCLSSTDLDNVGFKGALSESIDKTIICSYLESCVPFEVAELKGWFDTQKLQDKALILNTLNLKLDQFWDIYSTNHQDVLSSKGRQGKIIRIEGKARQN